MLSHLSIQNFALIDQLEIDFKPGLTVITGETGAGKSILLGALKLILGERADHSSLKNNEEKCIVEGNFKIEDYALKSFFEENDLDYAKDTIIRREITPQGKSRIFINDTPTTLGIAKSLGSALIDIHSQHQSLQINSSDFQLNVIDSLADNTFLIQKYKAAYKSYTEEIKKLNQLKELAIDAKKEKDFLEFQFEELSSLNLKEGEAEELSAEQQQLANSEEILSNFSQMEGLLSSQEGNVLEMIQQLKRLFIRNGDYLSSFKELNMRFQSIAIELEDISQSLSQEASNYEFDPDRQLYVEDRLAEIHRLQQKHQLNEADDLLSLLKELNEKLFTISNYDAQIEKQEQQLKEYTALVEDLAKQLQKKRLSILIKMQTTIVNTLKQLGIPHANFKVNHKESEEFLKTGKDIFTFLFSANKGIAPQQIEKTASGGEISRLVLAIKSLVAGKQKMPTIIFDEIDTGVSGEVASQLGTVLHNLAKQMQVVSITHLPQIAAKGKDHFFVYKKDKKERTTTKIMRLNESERLNEIAKMLSGKTITEAALNNARELLFHQ